MIRSRRYPTTRTMSWTPSSTRARVTCSRIGRFPTGIITFGSEAVKGPMRAPSPAARTTAFIVWPPRIPRSEEHTSELQSRSDLVCRLLLEDKQSSLDVLTRTCLLAGSEYHKQSLLDRSAERVERDRALTYARGFGRGAQMAKVCRPVTAPI